jgi:hypothetical protein
MNQRSRDLDRGQPMIISSAAGCMMQRRLITPRRQAGMTNEVLENITASLPPPARAVKPTRAGPSSEIGGEPAPHRTRSLA